MLIKSQPLNSSQIINVSLVKDVADSMVGAAYSWKARVEVGTSCREVVDSIRPHRAKSVQRI